ncbi:MAG: hypothetical protein HXY34_02380 [Candidatus Thorarchaeota archaeon]|nr:hypothetical protein [Candidatus Thorarchaeota archaeon]
MTSVVLSHGDLDGITSGAIALLAFPGSTFQFTRPATIHQDLHRLSKSPPSVISISDIAVNVQTFDRIVQAVESFPETTIIHWTDHHPLAERNRRLLSQKVELFHETGPCAAELVFRKFGRNLPDHAVRLALYGAIGDYCDQTAFASARFEDFDKRTLYFEAGILVQALQEMESTKSLRDLVFQLAMGVEPSSMNELVSLAVKATRIEHDLFAFVRNNARKMGNVGFVLDVPINGYRAKCAKFAAYCTDSIIGVSARSNADEVDLSIRRRNTDLDLNMALQTIMPEFPGAQGGGHPAAAGGSIGKTEFPAFIQRLAEYAQQSHPQFVAD